MNTDMSRHWLLEPGLTFLNHGAFGACPIPVLAAQAAWRERMENDPVRFFDGILPTELDRAREALGAFIHADPADLVFVPNATTGVNTVLRSLEPGLHAGDELLTTDHEYNATLNALGAIAARTGARVVVARVPFPVGSPAEVLDAILGRVGPRTRLAMVSHVTSATAVVFPIEGLAAALSSRGVDLLVDAAHAPGMVPLDIGRLADAGATYITGNGHKWLCGPKGAAFLWVRRDRQPGIRPLVTSHGANAPSSSRSRFQEEADWTGTADPSAILSLPAAIEFMASLHPEGWRGVMAANHALALAGRSVVADALGARRPVPDDMLGSICALPVPVDLPPVPFTEAGADPDVQLPEDPLHDELLERQRIQVPVYAWPPTPRFGPARRLLRISAQLYNDLDDYRRLADVLRSIRADASTAHAPGD